MKADRGIILSFKELYAQKKNNSNCSLILISSKCGTSVKNYLSNSLCPACILVSNKNKALYRFLIDFKKFVKLLILTNFLRLWKAVQVSKSSFIIKIDKLKNLVCLKNILDLKQQQSLKISIIIATKKLCLTFLDKEQSLFHQLAFLLKNIKNRCSINLFKSFWQLFSIIIFITAEGGIKNIITEAF